MNTTHSCWSHSPQRRCPLAAEGCRHAAPSCLLPCTCPLGGRPSSPSRSRRCSLRTQPGQTGGRARSSTRPGGEHNRHQFTGRLHAAFFYSHKKKKEKDVSHIAAASIIFTAFNLVQGGVREVEFLSPVIYGQAVGSLNVAADDHNHIGSIQRRPHDAGSLLVPVSPEHETGAGDKHRTGIMWTLPKTSRDKSYGSAKSNKSSVGKGKQKEIRLELGPECRTPSFSINDSLLTLVQHKGSGVVFSRHSDHSVAVIGHRAALSHSVASDGGGCVTGPVQCIPAAVVRQALHRPHICGTEKEEVGQYLWTCS